jgi:hypothetical protein
VRKEYTVYQREWVKQAEGMSNKSLCAAIDETMSMETCFGMNIAIINEVNGGTCSLAENRVWR